MASRIRQSSISGMSLIEALVALTLIGIALLFSMSLLAQEPLVLRRLEAHREALEVLDTVHEAIRTGMGLPLGPALVEWQFLYEPPRELETAQGLVVTSHVEPLSPDGLYRVFLRARYTVGNQSFDRVLETMVWRP